MKNKNVKQVIDTNIQLQNFLVYLQEHHEFSDEELEILKNANKHFDNLNIIFSKIKK